MKPEAQAKDDPRGLRLRFRLHSTFDVRRSTFDVKIAREVVCRCMQDEVGQFE